MYVLILFFIVLTECYEYFYSLPFSCRFPGRFRTEKTWLEEKKCHDYKYISYGIPFAEGGRDAERWEFPHVVCYFPNQDGLFLLLRSSSGRKRDC